MKISTRIILPLLFSSLALLLFIFFCCFTSSSSNIVHALRTIQCGDNNHDIYNESETLTFDSLDMTEFPCTSIIIRNSHIREIYASSANPIFVQNFEIRDVTIVFKAALKLGFFADIQNNKSISRQDSRAPSSTSTQYDETKKPTVILRNVTILGITRDPSTGALFMNNPGTDLRPLSFHQIPIIDPAHLSDRRYNENNRETPAFTLMFNKHREIEDTSQISQNFVMNVLARNFLHLVLIENCDFRDSVDSARRRSHSRNNYFGETLVGGQFIVRDTRYRGPYILFCVSDGIVLDGGQYIIYNSTFIKDDKNCTDCVLPQDDGSTETRQVLFEKTNSHNRRALAMRVASKNHELDLGAAIIFEGNRFELIDSRILDEINVVEIFYVFLGCSVTQDDIDDMERIDSMTPQLTDRNDENTNNNIANEDDYYFSGSVFQSRRFIFHGIIFHRNIVRVSQNRFPPGDSPGTTYRNVTSIEAFKIEQSLATARIVVLRNSIYLQRETRLWAIELQDNVLVPAGLAFVGNTIVSAGESDSIITVSAFTVDDLGFGPDHQLLLQRPLEKNLVSSLPARLVVVPGFASSSSSSSSLTSSYFDPRVIAKLSVHSNKINLTGSISRVKDGKDTFIVSLLAARLYRLYNINNVSVRKNGIHEGLFYENSVGDVISFVCGVGSFEGSVLLNISTYEFVNNTLIAEGSTNAFLGFGFENDHADNFGSVLVMNNIIDAFRLSAIPVLSLEGKSALLYLALRYSYASIDLWTYRNMLIGARSRLQVFAVLVIENSGPDLLRVHNNSFAVQLPTDHRAVSGTALVQIGGRGTASPAEQPTFAAQGFQPYNKKAQFFITHNSMRTARPSSVPESPELQQTNNFAAFGRLGLLSFQQFFDETATFTSLTLEDNTLTSEFGGVLNILASVGSFHPTSFASIKNNNLFAKGIGNSSRWHLQVSQAQRSKKVEIAALYMVPRVLPIVHSLVAFLGYNNKFVSDTNFVVENNSLIVENGFGRVSGIDTWACSEYEDQILPVSGTRRKCGFSGSIFFRNNIIRFSANPRSETKSSYLSLIDLGFGDALVDGRIQRLSFMGNEIVYEGTEKSSTNDGDQSCCLINSMPLKSSTGLSSSSSTLTFDNNNINFTNCKSSFFLGAVLPPRTTLTNNNMTVMSLPTSSTSSFINIPSSKLPYNTEITFNNNRLVINYSSSSSDEKNEVASTTSCFIRQIDIVSSSSSSTSKLTFTSNHIDNILDQDMTYDAAVRYAFDGKKSTSSSNLFQFSVESHLPNGKGCNTIDTERATEINPDFETAFNQQNMISSGQVTLLSSSSENFCNNFAGKNRSDDINTNATNSTNTTNETLNTTINTTTTAAPDEEDEEPNYSSDLQTANDAVGGLGIVVSSAAAGIVPSVGFGISRQQALVGFIQNIYDGDCSGVSVKDSIAAADSPTQFSIGNSDARFYIGGAVGNVIITVAFCSVAQLCGTLFLKFTGSSSWNRPFSVFARCHVAMMGFICMSLLFAPTLKFGLVVATLPSVPMGEKILGVLFSIFFTATTIYYSYWSIYSRERKEAYRMVRPLSKKEKEEQSFLARAFTFWFEGPGEWRMPLKNSKHGKGVTESDMLKFDAATPMLDGFQGHAYWFAVFEFCFVQFGLAFAEFLAQVVPSNKSCLTQGIVLLIVFTFYLFFCLWMRPFQELFNRIVTPLVTLFEIVVLALGFYFGVAGQQPGFIITLAMAAASMQSFVALVIFIASLSPIFKSLMKVYKRLKKKNIFGNKNNIQRRSGVSTLDTFRSALLENDDENDESEAVNLQTARNAPRNHSPRNESRHESHSKSRRSSNSHQRTDKKRDERTSSSNNSPRRSDERNHRDRPSSSSEHREKVRRPVSSSRITSSRSQRQEEKASSHHHRQENSNLQNNKSSSRSRKPQASAEEQSSSKRAGHRNSGSNSSSTRHRHSSSRDEKKPPRGSYHHSHQELL